MMKPALAVVVAVVLVGPAGAVALADDTFEGRAQSAVRIKRIDDLVWPLVAPCDRGDDVQQRQCRLVRDQKARAITGGLFLVDGDAGAFVAGSWSAAKKSLPLTLIACIHCAGIAIDGRTWHVTGMGATRIEDGKLRPVTLFDNIRMFADEAAATAWLDAVKTARVQYLVKVPDKADKRRWQLGGKDGLALDIVGYRVYAPCDGAIVVANPPAKHVEPDKKACAKGTSDAGSVDGVDALTPAMVQDAMKPVVDAANLCHVQFNVSGKAKLEITIAGDGTVAKYEQTGDFVGTPTGQCIDAAGRKVQFPRSKKPTTKIGYPIILQ
jgi:hypothetical protein